MRTVLVATHPVTLAAGLIGVTSLLIVAAVLVLAFLTAVFVATVCVLVLSALDAYRDVRKQVSSGKSFARIPLTVIEAPADLDMPPLSPQPWVMVGPDENGRPELIESLVDEPAPRPLYAPSAAQITREPKRANRTEKVEAARKLLAEGKSRRAVAAQVGVAESTLRRWLRN